jgi:hypothetical protein
VPFSKLYLTRVAAPYAPATLRGSWDDFAGAVTCALDSVKGFEQITSVARAETSLTDEWDVLLYRGITGPLAAQTLSGTITCVLGVTESNANANFHWHWHVYVTQGDSDIPRGTLLVDYREALGVNEWGTLSTNSRTLSTAQTLSSLVISTGDRLVIEIGYTARNTVATSYTGTLYYGASGVTDLTTAAGTNAATIYPGSIIFSNAITESSSAARVTQLVAETITPPVTFARVTFLVVETVTPRLVPSVITTTRTDRAVFPEFAVIGTSTYPATFGLEDITSPLVLGSLPARSTGLPLLSIDPTGAIVAGLLDTSEMPVGPEGPPGPQGEPGISAGRIFYYDATDASDIAGYKRMLEAPSPNPESMIAVSCSGTGDVAVEEFATDAGVPGAVDYPAGTAYRRLYARTSAGEARLHLQIYVRTAAGVETLVRDEFSPAFINTTVALQAWMATPSTGGAMAITDRIVNKLYAQRVSGPASITVTVHFEGPATGSHVQTTISAGGVGPAGPGVAPGGTAGQVLTKASATDYDTMWGAGAASIHAATHEPGGSDALAALSASILTSGTLANARLATDVVVTGSVTAGSFVPNLDATVDLGGPSLRFKDLYLSGIATAAGLGTTPLNATRLMSGIVPDGRLSGNVLKYTGGYPGNTTDFLRADGTFAIPVAGGGAHAVTHEAGGADPLTALDAGILTSGTLPDARLSANVLKHTGGYPGGTTNYLRADGTFATPSGTAPDLTAYTRRDTAETIAQPWTFTQDQTIEKSAAALFVKDPTGALNTKSWRMFVGTSNRDLRFASMNDDGSQLANVLNLNRDGSAIVGTTLSVPTAITTGSVYEGTRTTAMGYWVDVPFNAANFSGFTFGTMSTNRYTLIGQTVIWQIAFLGCNVPTATADLGLVPPVPIGTANFQGGGFGHFYTLPDGFQSGTWIKDPGNSLILLRNAKYQTGIGAGQFEVIGTLIYKMA